MKTYLIDFIFSDKAIQVLFRTLVHSLWQGILLAAFAALILIYTKRSRTALRYKLLTGIFISFIAVSLFTFCYEIYSVMGIVNTTNDPVLINISKHIIHDNYRISFIERLIATVQPYENLIVFSWFIIIALKSVGMLAGLRNIYMLKHRKVFDAGEYWNHQLGLLSKRAGIGRSVVLLKSLIVEVPMVAGYFKPVILFPAAALTNLAPEEIEAILLHELAHIRRNDFLVNILQRMAEIIFFFNPAVLWISFLIKEERENCCDDIAVQQTKNKKQFIHALLSFQEHNAASGYATSFSGRKYYLLNRIRRIITNNNKTLNNMEKTFLVSGIIVTSFAAFAFSNHKQSSPGNIAVAQPTKIVCVTNKKDTVPQTVNNNESKYTMTTSIDGKQYRMVEVNGKVTELYVDNVKIPDNKISDYNAVIARLQEKLKADKENQEEAVKAQKEALEAQAEAVKAKQLAMNDVMDKQAKINEDIMKLQNAQMAAQAEKLEALMQQKDTLENGQAEKLEEMMKEKELYMNEQAKKFADMAKENNALLKEQTAKQALIMAKQKDVVTKEQTEYLKKITKDQNQQQQQLINEDLKRQIEELKEQNKKLQQQLNQKSDSLYKSKQAAPQGA